MLMVLGVVRLPAMVLEMVCKIFERLPFLSSNVISILIVGLLDIEDCNFIAVDWSELASDMYEVVGRDNVPIVGIKTAALVDFLVYEGASLGTFHLIGFSMGAHVVGIAGSNVKSGRLPRITGKITVTVMISSWSNRISINIQG